LEVNAVTKAFLGFTLLIAALFPVGGYLAEILYGETPGVLPSVLYPLFFLAMVYLPAAGRLTSSPAGSPAAAERSTEEDGPC
jgi:hypothetical protein